jgi:hypothetical protein
MTRQMSTRIYHLTMDTDSNAERFVKLGRAAIKQVDGELTFSRGFGTVAPVVVLILPENVRPESILPGITWTEYTEA